MTEILIPMNLMFAIAGFYALPHIPRRPALSAGIAVSASMTIVRAILLHDQLSGIPLYFLSCIIGAVIIYALAARFDNLFAMILITPLGCLVLLCGGPIMIGMTLYEIAAGNPSNGGG